MLLKRTYSYGRRKLGALWHKLFLCALVVPWLRIRGELSKPYSVHPAYRGAVVVEQKRLYKVALGRKSTIAIEYGNYVQASQRWPELHGILPDCQFHDEFLFSYLTMTRYQPIGLERAIVHASNLYQLMRTCRSPETQTIAMSDSEELGAGFEVISQLYDDATSRAVHEHVESFLNSGDYHVGFAHGDFHSRNIMVDDCGKPRLIDLDCIRLNGIQELDALYFVLEMEWSESGALWYRTIVDFLCGSVPCNPKSVLSGFGVENSFALGVTYLVDRIGQESRNFGFKYTREMLGPAIGEIQSVKRKSRGASQP